MELLTTIATCFLLLSFVFVPCASDQIQVKRSPEKVHEEARSNLIPLPRKLKLNEEVKSVQDGDIGAYKKNIKASSGKYKFHQKQKNLMHPRKGTWKKRTDSKGEKQPEYFVMDYSWVRRRRPIHNKNVPVGP